MPRPRTAFACASLILGGCGRIGFDSPDNARSDGARDGLVVDLPANAITVTFGEASSTTFQNVTIDTFISNEAGESGFNYGITDVLRSEQDVSERILLRFDLSAIPTTSTVVDATLTVEITQANPAATLELHPVLQPWAEGSADGSSGVPSFSSRGIAANWDTTGCGEPGSAGPTFASAKPAAQGPMPIALPPSTVQEWVAAPAQNFGMVFYNTHDNSVRFASREHSTPAFRPLLMVSYLP